MVTPELQKYVTEQRAAGMADDVLREALLGADWPVAAVNEVLKKAPVQFTEKEYAVRAHRLVDAVAVVIILFVLVGGVIAYVWLRGHVVR